MFLDEEIYRELLDNLKLNNYGLSDLQKRYLDILKDNDIIWLSTIANILNVSEKVIEKDIEPLLLNIWIIEKTKKWRKFVKLDLS